MNTDHGPARADSRGRSGRVGTGSEGIAGPGPIRIGRIGPRGGRRILATTRSRPPLASVRSGRADRQPGRSTIPRPGSSPDAVGLRPRPERRQYVRDGDQADFPAADHNGDGLALGKDRGWTVSLRLRPGLDLDPSPLTSWRRSSTPGCPRGRRSRRRACGHPAGWRRRSQRAGRAGQAARTERRIGRIGVQESRRYSFRPL